MLEETAWPNPRQAQTVETVKHLSWDSVTNDIDTQWLVSDAQTTSGHKKKIMHLSCKQDHKQAVVRAIW